MINRIIVRGYSSVMYALSIVDYASAEITYTGKTDLIRVKGFLVRNRANSIKNFNISDVREYVFDNTNKFKIHKDTANYVPAIGECVWVAWIDGSLNPQVSKYEISDRTDDANSYTFTLVIPSGIGTLDLTGSKIAIIESEREAGAADIVPFDMEINKSILLSVIPISGLVDSF